MKFLLGLIVLAGVAVGGLFIYSGQIEVNREVISESVDRDRLPKQ